MTIQCLTCNHTGLQKVRPYRTKTAHGRALFGHTWLYECRQCGLVQTVPRPTLQQLADYYAVDYRNGCFAGADVANLAEFPKDNLFYYNRGQSIADLLSPHVPEADSLQILDIGAGFGHILHALGERYPQAHRTAIEFSQVCVDHLRSLGIEVFTDPAEEALPRLGRRFDVVILSHVLEHLLEPRQMLQTIFDHLNPGGILYVEVPHIPRDSLKKYIDSVWAPRFEEPHITLFSPPVLRALLESTGFDVPFCDTAGLEYKYISALQFHLPHWRWFLQRLTPKPVFDFLRRRSAAKGLRVKEREESFYQYGGNRIWIRSISRKK